MWINQWWELGSNVINIVSQICLYLKQKQRTPNLTFFAQMVQLSRLQQNRYVKHRILHVMRDADAILHVKTTELYYITGGSARGKKWSQKHGGFWRLLMRLLMLSPWQLVRNPLANYHWPTTILMISQRHSPSRKCFIYCCSVFLPVFKQIWSSINAKIFSTYGCYPTLMRENVSSHR